MSVVEFPSPAKARFEQTCFAYTAVEPLRIPANPDAEPPDADERRKALEIGRSWIVEAPAGSGKTGLLIQRYLKLLAVVDEPEAVLALTFTNKATAEMRDRVLDMLERAAKEPLTGWSVFEQTTWSIARDVLLRDGLRGWKLREQPHRLNIRTIDSFCGEIARAAPILSGGIGLASPVPDASELYAAAARRVFLRLGAGDAALDAAIRTVLLQRDGNLADCEALLAEMLSTREQWGELVPLEAHVLSTKVLDAVVLPRLNEALESTICSALRDLKKCFPEHLLTEMARLANALAGAEGYKDEPNPLGACAGLVRAPEAGLSDLKHWKMLAHLLITEGGGWRKQINAKYVQISLAQSLRERLKEVLRELQACDNLLPLLCDLRELPPETYPEEQWRVAKALFQLLRHALAELRLLFAEREVCDFAELSIAARIALGATDGAERVFPTAGMRLEHLLVDEMQDTSSSQYELLESLTAGWDGQSQTVFLVGDPKQSIYLFRQARVERFIQGLRSGRLGQIALGPLHLRANFRSGSSLVEEFNGMFGRVFAGNDAEVTHRPAVAVRHAAEGEELRWHAHALPRTSDRMRKTAERRRAERTEAEAIAELALEWSRKPLPEGRREPWKIAVLVRARNHVLQVTRKLAEAGVPFHAVEIERLNERPEVLDCMALARALLHPADRVSWLAVLRAPWCGLSLRDLHTLSAGDEPRKGREPLRGSFHDRLPLLPQTAEVRVLRTLDVLDTALAQRGRSTVAQAVERAWYSLGGDLLADASAKTNVRRFFELLEEMEGRGETIDAHRLGVRVQRLFAEPEVSVKAVDVMTIHKAKGLEWDLVMVPGLQKGSGRNAPPLLDWMELPTRGRDGHAQVLLAPIPARGDEAGSLNLYLRKQRRNQERSELKRVLYVVATRARTSLHLFASPRRTKSGGIEQRDGSLLKTASAAIIDQFDDHPIVNDGCKSEMPDAHVLARVFTPCDSTGASEAPELRLALAASSEEQVSTEQRREHLQGRLPIWVSPRDRLRAMTSARERAPATRSPEGSFVRPQGSLVARALGNTVHAFLELLAVRLSQETAHGIDPKDLIEEVQSWRNRIETVLRSGGLPPREISRKATKTVAALEKTLTYPEGRWLLQPHPGGVNEAEIGVNDALRGMRLLRMDRSFFGADAPLAAGESVLWIVDYKTSTWRASGPEGCTEKAFLRSEREKYEPQLRGYAEARLRAMPPGTPVMLALYYPLLPKLQYWRYWPLE